MEDKEAFLIVALILAGFLLYNYSSFFGIGIISPQVQYYNKPIVAEFTLTNYTNPLIQVYFNDKEIYQLTGNQTNETISFTRNLVNGTYDFKLENIISEGILRIVVSENNVTEVQTIEVKQPYVAITSDIPTLLDKGIKITINIKTLNPQGEPISADSVDAVVTKPDNTQQTLILTPNSDNTIFSKEYDYSAAGNYVFKIHPRKLGYATVEETALTSVLKAAGIPIIVWIWTGALIIIIILFGIKQVRIRI